MFDEVNGALAAGVQYWQVDKTKPLTAILYEPDGHTMYAWNRRKEKNATERVYREVLRKKQAYIGWCHGVVDDSPQTLAAQGAWKRLPHFSDTTKNPSLNSLKFLALASLKAS